MVCVADDGEVGVIGGEDGGTTGDDGEGSLITMILRLPSAATTKSS